MNYINLLPIGSTFTTRTFIIALQLFRQELNTSGKNIFPYQTYGNDNKTLTMLIRAGIVERTSRGNYTVKAHTKPGFSRYMFEAIANGRTLWEKINWQINKITKTELSPEQVEGFKQYIIQ
jgi:hypothetical protein